MGHRAHQRPLPPKGQSRGRLCFSSVAQEMNLHVHTLCTLQHTQSTGSIPGQVSPICVSFSPSPADSSPSPSLPRSQVQHRSRQKPQLRGLREENTRQPLSKAGLSREQPGKKWPCVPHCCFRVWSQHTSLSKPLASSSEQKGNASPEEAACVDFTIQCFSTFPPTSWGRVAKGPE